MDLTIVIVNWNGGEMLLRCLRSIRASRHSFGVKVIVVDNDSQDGSREAAQREFPEFHIFNSGANLGFGKANNLTRPMIDTALVLFLNPDTEVRPDTLEKAVRCLGEHPDVGSVGCKMLYPDGTVQEQGVQWHLSPWRVFVEMMLVRRNGYARVGRCLPVLDPNQSGYVRKLYGGFFLTRKEVLDRAGWFDERYFMYAEDADLSRTIQSLGWKLYYTADTEIIHVAGGTSQKAPSGFSILMKHESIGKLMRKYYGPTGLARYRAVIFVGAGFRLLVLLLLRAASAIRAYSTPGKSHASLLKERLMLCWALGLKTPVTPGQQPAQSGLGSRPVCTNSG